MASRDRQLFADLLLIVGSFIFAETIVRAFIDLADGKIAAWVLPAFAIAIIISANELKNRIKGSFYSFLYNLYLGIAIFLIVLVKNEMITNLTFIHWIFYLSLIMIATWVIHLIFSRKKNVKIVMGKEKDIDQIANVEMSSGYHKKKFDFKPTVEQLFKEKTEVIVAKEKKSIIGYITLSANGEIAFLAVSKKHQGKGVANKLIMKVISKAKTKKIKKLFLDVKEDNFSAIKLYSKYGFKVSSVNKKKINGAEMRKLRMVR